MAARPPARGSVAPSGSRVSQTSIVDVSAYYTVHEGVPLRLQTAGFMFLCNKVGVLGGFAILLGPFASCPWDSFSSLRLRAV